jgi:hypothetical protein
MFKLNMDAIRESAKDVWLMANVANVANLPANEPDFSFPISQLAGLATFDGQYTTEPPEDPAAWRELSDAYHRHHVNCPTCQAAGRGTRYGLRCGTGASLWTAYNENAI